MNAHLAALGISEESIASRGLQECQEATELDIAEIGADGRQHMLIPSAAKAWRELKVAAVADGIVLFIVSAFRSVERQAEIVRRKLETGVSAKDVLEVCAPPGFSEHHTGRAVDLSTPGSRPLETEFEQTAAHAWLQQNAARFGFRLSYPVGNPWGYQHEPWHWCFHDAQLGSAANAREAKLDV
jgi:D-alanyl-D-alanine carboxypeptidase